jgi:DNA-binding response OmpR family regulator
MPIIFLSSRDDEIDRIVGLENRRRRLNHQGRSAPASLCARVGAAFFTARRPRRPTVRKKPAATDDSSILRRRTAEEGPRTFQGVRGNVEVVRLDTSRNLALLKTLMAHPGKVYNAINVGRRVLGMNIFVTDPDRSTKPCPAASGASSPRQAATPSRRCTARANRSALPLEGSPAIKWKPLLPPCRAELRSIC